MKICVKGILTAAYFISSESANGNSSEIAVEVIKETRQIRFLARWTYSNVEQVKLTESVGMKAITGHQPCGIS